MMTSWNETAQIEKYIFKKLSPEDSLLFEAKMLTNPLLKWNVIIQKKTHTLIHQYHRKKLKEEAEAAYQLLCNNDQKQEFHQTIRQLFK